MAEELVFKAIDSLTEDEDDLWVLATIARHKVIRFRELYAELREYAIPEYRIRKSFTSLLDKRLIVRVRRGSYTANMRAILGKAMELLEAEEEKAAEFG